ncbi:MAG: hypothetical protein PPP58_04120 [Natronomonas sp.]
MIVETFGVFLIPAAVFGAGILFYIAVVAAGHLREGANDADGTESGEAEKR